MRRPHPPIDSWHVTAPRPSSLWRSGAAQEQGVPSALVNAVGWKEKGTAACFASWASPQTGQMGRAVVRRGPGLSGLLRPGRATA